MVMPEMSHTKQKVVVALSGGLDSSVTTALLLDAGYACQGVFIITSEVNRHAQAEAEDVAQRLGIDLAVLDLRGQFQAILDYFFAEYRKARTPNPCVVCNRQVKFGRLWEFAQEAGAQFLATGQMLRPPYVIGEIPNLTTHEFRRMDKTVTLPAVMAATWRAPDGSVGLIAANATAEPLSVTLQLDPADLGWDDGPPVRRSVTIGGLDATFIELRR